jgi:hypothetical protein
MSRGFRILDHVEEQIIPAQLQSRAEHTTGIEIANHEAEFLSQRVHAGDQPIHRPGAFDFRRP